jgi:hypothetical protein
MGFSGAPSRSLPTLSALTGTLPTAPLANCVQGPDLLSVASSQGNTTFPAAPSSPSLSGYKSGGTLVPAEAPLTVSAGVIPS